MAPRQIPLSPQMSLPPHIATPVMSAATVCSFDSQQIGMPPQAQKILKFFGEMGGTTKSDRDTSEIRKVTPQSHYVSQPSLIPRMTVV